MTRSRVFKGFLVPALVLFLVLQLGFGVLACTSLLVTPGASYDKSTSVTHTCDSGSSFFQVEKVPAKDWPEGSMVDVLILPQYTDGWALKDVAGGPSGKQIPQVRHTYGYLKSVFGLMNEKQVGIGETTISGRSESENPNGYFDVTNLSMLAMERGATAREAIKIMGELAEKFGYKDGGEELSVSDPNEAWVFEIVGPGPLWAQGSDKPGAYWVARRVPNGHVAASANNAVISKIEPEDTANFLCAPGIIDYAIAQGWYDPKSGEEFSWRKHFCNAVSWGSCARRVWRAMTLAAPSLAAQLDEKNLPFSVPVDKPLSLQDIAKIKRDHLEGTDMYPGDEITGGPWNNPRRYRGRTFKYGGKSYSWQRPIAQVQCEYLLITQSRSWLPDEIGGVIWYGPANPDATCLVPLYASVKELTPALNVNAGSHHKFTRQSFWWAISAVNTYADLRFSDIIKDINKMQDKWEGQAMRDQVGIDAAASELYRKDPAAAVTFLTNYCNNNVVAVRDAWWEFLDYLIWKYNMGFLHEDGKVKGLGYPQTWLPKVINEDAGDHYLGTD